MWTNLPTWNQNYNLFREQNKMKEPIKFLVLFVGTRKTMLCSVITSFIRKKKFGCTMYRKLKSVIEYNNNWVGNTI